MIFDCYYVDGCVLVRFIVGCNINNNYAKFIYKKKDEDKGYSSIIIFIKIKIPLFYIKILTFSGD